MFKRKKLLEREMISLKIKMKRGWKKGKKRGRMGRKKTEEKLGKK